MKLFIVESPAKARTIKSFLGQDYVVEASRGHVREMPEHELSVDIEHGFAPTYIVSESKREVVASLKSLATRADEIIIATDPDREGEAIAWHIYELLDPISRGKSKRVSYHEITKKAVLSALANPREIDMNLVDAAKARQVLDRLIGYKVSPVLWSTVGKGTSAGRVQSVALKLVCDRQREIEAFKPSTYWYVDVVLGCEGGDFVARVVVPKEKDNKFLDKKLATEALERLTKASYVMADVQKATKSIKPSPPFDTNSLQGACSSVLKWDITKAMKVAQSLYEAGKVSYIRTDSFAVSDEALASVRDYILGTHGNAYLPRTPHTYEKKAAAAAQEAHECIRPTHIEDRGESLSGDDRKMYDLIRSRFIACQMASMTVDSVVYLVSADCGEKLVASGQTISFDGFTSVWQHKNTKDEMLPLSSKGAVLVYKKSKQTENKTKPPSRFTDALLVDKMEKDGVGRPATRGPIVKALEDKGYTTKDKSILVPTPMGHAIVDFLTPSFPSSFMDVKFTAGMEEKMLKIANGEDHFESVVLAFYEALKIDISKTKGGDRKPDVKLGVKCSACGEGEIVEKTGKFGKFFSCGNYPKCKTVFIKDGDKYTPSKKKDTVQTDKKCPKCGNSMILRSSDYGKFLGCGAFPTCRYKENVKE